ncbi:MAG: phenylalanine--tRNA ligase subunit beta [marine benthic group bacterium]|nr:phenylalanine--tRNA ligase subunit beta [Candidatus Benthicola marisminoris]
MDVSVSWLRALAPSIDGSPEHLASLLSSRAVPVDRVESFGDELDDVVIARVLEVGKHPNADRLSLCRVNAGSGEPLDVVCGAPNVVSGACYPFIPAGGTLPGGFKIERRKIRGQVSNGMLCSEKELGLGRDAAGIMRLGDDHTPGEPFARVMGLPDARLELDLTPNRIDLACHRGVARELAPGGEEDVVLPSFGGPVWEPTWVSGATDASAGGVKVAIEDPERCFRYLAAIVRNVQVGPSPEWLQARLRAAGSRPINNVVDSTNYVLLELNQPLHAFDLEKVGGAEIRVRAARGEDHTTLDGTEHRLGSEVTVIADAEWPVALAGVMGGADSEVSGSTSSLLIECASFDPRHTRNTARATGLATDASYRFERGIDESGMEAALRRCVELILVTAGGSADGEALRVGRAPVEAPAIRLRPARIQRVLGIELSPLQIRELLVPLGFEVGEGDDDLQVVPPGWRPDVRAEVDLLEEVARRYGYESFPHEPRAFRPSAVPDSPVWHRASSVRSALSSMGALEARSASFASEDRTAGNPARLLKPLSEAESLLRTDLVPVLLGRVEHNWSRGRRDVRLYEIGNVFQRTDADRKGSDDLPVVEETRVGLAITGLREPPHWSGNREDIDLWDLKGWLETLASTLGLGDIRPGEPDASDAGLPFGCSQWLGGESFCIFDEGGLVGVAGRVGDEAMDLPVWAAPVYAAEFRLHAVTVGSEEAYAQLPTYPAVSRDLAFVLDRSVSAADVEATIRSAAPATLESLSLFDVYEGDELGEGLQSLAWRLVFRAADRTLRDEEVEEGLRLITVNLEERFDARIRSS